MKPAPEDIFFVEDLLRDTHTSKRNCFRLLPNTLNLETLGAQLELERVVDSGPGLHF